MHLPSASTGCSKSRNYMRRITTALLLACTACGVVSQPDSIRIVAAFEVPLPTPVEREAFLTLLRREAEVHGFHVDAATKGELQSLSEVSPMTMNAAIWRGKNDDESVAAAMDFRDHLGRIWITFDKGEDPPRFAKFREGLMRKVVRRWPQTLSLPIMPTGAIPLASDLVRTPSGYAVNPSAEGKYQASPTPPAPSSAVR
jgi:hypothetical protein